eukprot:1180966-Prorocentrum_minimum.AAC.2
MMIICCLILLQEHVHEKLLELLVLRRLNLLWLPAPYVVIRVHAPLLGGLLRVLVALAVIVRTVPALPGRAGPPRPPTITISISFAPPAVAPAPAPVRARAVARPELRHSRAPHTGSVV